MRNWFTYLLVGMLSWSAYASEDFKQGIKAYNDKSYQTAADFFLKHLKSHPDDVSGYYNLALTNFELKNYGKAIWAFEKTLEISPNDTDAKEKLQKCYEQLEHPTEWEPRLDRFSSVLYGFSSSTWAIFSILFSCILSFTIGWFAKTTSPNSKKLAALLGGISVVALIFSLVIASGAHGYRSSNSYGIVTQKAISTFSEQKEITPTQLHEGMRVELLEPVDGKLVHVKTLEGNTYIISKEDIEVI